MLCGAEPSQVLAVIRSNGRPDVKGEYVSSIAWRMFMKKELVKLPGTSAYALLENEKALDPNAFAGDGSQGLFRDPEAQGVKASPGGEP